ncbi:MAG: hypothetical protein Kow0077_29130 [Anaerolineae bacterium]
MFKKTTLSLTLVIIVLLVSSLSGATAQGDTGTVWGTVLLGGAPLPDVEVWLRVNGTNHYTCTDANGEFVFTNVPAGYSLTSATGIAVSEPCVNAKFLDLSGRGRGFPLYWQFQNPGQLAPDGVLNLTYNVVRWPIDFDRALTNHILNALTQMVDRNNEAGTYAAVDRFETRVQTLFADGKITGDARNNLISRADDFRDVIAIFFGP